VGSYKETRTRRTKPNRHKETIKEQGRCKHEKEWINGRDDERRTYGWWSNGVSRHLMGWNHQDKWDEATT